MALVLSDPDYVCLGTDVAMTGQAAFVDRLMHLGFILAAVGVMTGIAESCFNRSMQEFLFIHLLTHIAMALVTQRSPAFRHRVLRATLAGVAVSA